MWPAPESGFEVNASSPMGAAEREVRVARGLPALRHTKAALVTLAITTGIVVPLFLVGVVVSATSLGRIERHPPPGRGVSSALKKAPSPMSSTWQHDHHKRVS